MLDMKDDTLRARLRRETTAVHDRLDRAVSGLDLSSLQGFSTFVAMQEAAFAALVDAGVRGVFVTQECLADLHDACRLDLKALGRAPVARLGAAKGLRAEAVDHIILGSRLGTEVLRPRWQASDDARVVSADAYFSQPSLQTLWRQHCDALNMTSASDDAADAILADAQAIFELFHAALISADWGKQHD